MKNDAPPSGPGGGRNPEVHSHRREAVVVPFQPEREVVIVPVLLPAPDDLAESEHPWEKHILDLPRVRHPFRPHVPLRPQDMFRLFGGEIGGNRFVGIDRVDGEISSYRHGFSELPLVVVEITIGSGRHDHIMAGLCRIPSSRGPAPRHDGGPRSEAPLKDFIPADETLAFRAQDFLDSLDKITLKLALVLQALGLDAFLTLDAVSPAELRAFVPADVQDRKSTRLNS